LDVWLLVIATVGTMVAHAPSYRLVIPAAVEGVTLFAATGHGLRALTVVGALLLGVLSVATVLAARFRSGLLGRRQNDRITSPASATKEPWR
jgi:hypothetical protein